MTNQSSLRPKTESQKKIVRSIHKNDITLVSGYAGTGKTLHSLVTLLDLLSNKSIRKIVVIRLIAETFGESLGALPGEAKDKMLPFMGPIYDNLSLIRTKSQINYLFDKGMIEVIPVSQVRGRSFNDTGVLVDECQQMSVGMILACLTRIGERSKLVFCGDKSQHDFAHKRKDGISYLDYMLEDLPNAGIVRLGVDDIVRNSIIQHIVKRHEEYLNQVS